MSNLEKAIKIEKQLRSEHRFFYGTFIPKIQELGFKTIDEYLELKKKYLFENWKPKVYKIFIEDFAEKIKEAINNEQAGIYIPYGNEIHAYHGTDEIDYDLCNGLGVKVIELGYTGGTIIGSDKDLSMLIIFPKIMMMNEATITNKFVDTIARYVPDTALEGNDILVNDKKVAGTTWRNIGDISVWTIQVSFEDYSQYISQICQKPAIKKPSYIVSTLLTRDLLEKEIIAWLRKEEVNTNE